MTKLKSVFLYLWSPEGHIGYVYFSTYPHLVLSVYPY